VKTFNEDLERKKTQGKEKLSEFDETILLYQEDSALWDFVRFNQ